ncbi:MAG: DUF1905 domain-containing protein [Holosporales bacterium]|jgi:hypothetical protein
MIDMDFTFSSELWMYSGKGAWFFITVPQDVSAQIKFFTEHHRRGWGSVGVSATIGNTRWQTSIFPDATRGAYLLPVKAAVRKKENIGVGSRVSVILHL